MKRTAGVCRSAGDVTAVVINHDGGDRVARCVEALARCRPAPKSVIVVDNASTDGSREYLSRTHPDLEIVALAENHGPSVARNAGLKRAASDWVLLVDDDVILEENTLERLVQAQAGSGAAVVTPRVRFHPEGSVQCDGARAHFLGTMALANENRELPDDPHASAAPVGALISACLLVDRKLALEAGGFDELYFIYLEDLEFSLRIRALGHELVCAPNAVVHHDRGRGTEGLSFRGAEYPPRRAYLTHRNRWLTLLIHYRLQTLAVLLPALLAFELASIGFFVARGWSGEWLRSWRWLLAKRVDIRARREHLRRSRVRDDVSLVEGGPIPLATGVLRSAILQRGIRWLSSALDVWWQVARRVLAPHGSAP